MVKHNAQGASKTRHADQPRQKAWSNPDEGRSSRRPDLRVRFPFFGLISSSGLAMTSKAVARSSTTILSMLILGASAATGQTVTPIPGGPTCSTCQLTLERVVSLGSLSDPTSIMRTVGGIQHDSKGRYLATGTPQNSDVLVYDSTGRYVDTWGRNGDGPGEFRAVRDLMLLPGDSLLVHDRSLQRLTVLDTDGKYVWSSSHPALQLREVAPFSDSLWVAAGSASSPDRIGYALHFIRPDGTVTASFGGPYTIVSSRPSLGKRIIVHKDQRLWAVRLDRYEVEEWRLEARPEMIRLLDREIEWFPDRDVEGVTTGTEPRNPWIRDLYVDDNDLLWVIASVQDLDFPGSYTGGGVADKEGTYDSMIEVIDLRTNEVLVSQRFREFLRRFTSDGLIVGYRAESTGLVVVDIWRPQLSTLEGPTS
jgi:hypothetical protein